jgi:hypothetical protein|tara:strand:+ start:846 stop:1313 length:468 start_codon:yes stop_codon:yes gene_type:complete
MTVWYFHGLESEAGGPKVNFLNSVAEEVYAPTLDYSNHKLFGKLYKKGLATPPDLIIGSSMGGYLADALASHFGIEVLLFNPALHSRSIDRKFPYGKSNWERNFVVGTEDTVIDPKATLVYKDIAKSYTEIQGMGHRTSLSVFTDIYSKWNLNQL